MNEKSSFQHLTTYRASYTEEQQISELIKHMLSWFPQLPQEYIIVCIGTDRSTGDALGPLVGTLLSEKRPNHLTIYGTLHEPVHATNLSDYLDKIKEKHRRPFIIAIDACLGKHTSIGQLISGIGPLKPGAALNKSLPEVGDIHLTGVVNTGGFMDHAVLQSTRLSVVMDMANRIANLLETIDQQLAPSFMRPAILKRYPEEYNFMQEDV
jgi:putative sporulation protein YyaC